MSLTITVPASVPSDFHNSRPWTPSSAVKYRVLPTATRLSGPRYPYGEGLMSLTRSVPASVPADFHSSRPWTASSAGKNRHAPTAVGWQGEERQHGLGEAARSITV